MDTCCAAEAKEPTSSAGLEERKVQILIVPAVVPGQGGHTRVDHPAPIQGQENASDIGTTKQPVGRGGLIHPSSETLL